MTSLNTPLMKVLSVITISTMLNGCATLSKQECLMGNWEAIGFSDGVAGRDATQLAAHNKACAKANIAPDYTLWEKGRQEGLKQYCTDTNAYNIGKHGQTINGVCPTSSNIPRLERINADGRAYYSLNKQLTVERDRLKEYREEYDKLRDGDNLAFANEKDARAYLLTLPKKMQDVQLRIDNLQEALLKLKNQYGY